MPDVTLVWRLFQGIVSYRIKEVEGKGGPEKTQCFLNSVAIVHEELPQAQGCRQSHSMENIFLLLHCFTNWSDPELCLAEGLDCPAQGLSAVSCMLGWKTTNENQVPKSGMDLGIQSRAQASQFPAQSLRRGGPGPQISVCHSSSYMVFAGGRLEPKLFKLGVDISH